jgi:transposase
MPGGGICGSSSRLRASFQRRTSTAAVELKIDGVAVKIGRDAEASLIAAVIEALRATR